METKVKSPGRAEKIRRRVFEIIETAKEDDRLSNVYDVFMMIVIVASLVPLAFKESNRAFEIIDKVAVIIFIIDYLLRLFTADLKLKKGALSFLMYPITPMAIIDLLCILPSLSIISGSFRILKVFRLFRTLRVFRVFKAVRYSKSIMLIKHIFEAQRRPLATVGALAVVYILISALIIFNVEPDSFDNFFESIYYSTVSLTTMGYGDICPVSTIGRIVAMASSIFGIAIIALPSGIITAGFMEELNKKNEEAEKEKARLDAACKDPDSLDKRESETVGDKFE